MRSNRPLRFRYHGGTIPAALREVTPGHLYTVEGFPGAYLSGYCHIRHAERTFLVSRIQLPADVE